MYTFLSKKPSKAEILRNWEGYLPKSSWEYSFLLGQGQMLVWQPGCYLGHLFMLTSRETVWVETPYWTTSYSSPYLRSWYCLMYPSCLACLIWITVRLDSPIWNTTSGLLIKEMNMVNLVQEVQIENQYFQTN